MKRTSFLMPALLLIGLLLCLPPARAELATESEARLVAENWLAYVVFEAGAWAGDDDPTIADTQEIVVSDTLLGWCYVVYPEGHIVVPALKALPPIKSCSDDSPLNVDDPEGYPRLIREELLTAARRFAGEYDSLEAAPSQTGAAPLAGRHGREWNLFLTERAIFAERLTSGSLEPLTQVGPLLTTSWHQGAPYNNYCPIGDGGGHCVVGCVATAIAQILRYHSHPPSGHGDFCYYWDGDQSCGGNVGGGDLCADFSDPYAWDLMPDDCSSGCTHEQEEALAELCYEVGVACAMDYGCCGSGGYCSPLTFSGRFGYDHSADEEYRPDHTAEGWFAIIQEEINASRPVYYTVDMTAAGHAIVCDGWRDTGGLNQLHMNYGWGGSSTAWYTEDDLIGSSHGLIRHIEPAGGLLNEVFVDCANAGYEDGSEDHPFNTIDEATTVAAPSGTIHVAPGVYTGPQNKNLTLYGKSISLIGASGPDSTIIDCQQSGRGFYIWLPGHAGLIQGFTIRNARDPVGAGLYLNGSSVTLRDIVVEGCYASILGGGMYLSGGAPTLEGVIVINNGASQRGGGICCSWFAEPMLDGVTLDGNWADSGGGICVRGTSSPTIVRTIVSRSDGDGVYCEPDSYLEIYHSCVFGNASGDSLCGYHHDNLFVEPLFCNAESGDYTLQSTSACLPGGNPWGELIGARGHGCPGGPGSLDIEQDGASLHLTWSPPPEERVDVDHYVVYRDTTEFPHTQVATVDAPDTTFTDITIPPCMACNYWVSAAYSDGSEGPPSNRVSGEVCYGGPVGFHVTYGEGANELVWGHAEGAVNCYVILRGNEESQPDSLASVAATDTSYVDGATGDCPRDSYGYQVLPVYDTGWRGIVSDYAAVDPPPAAPEGLTAEWSGNHALLVWNPNCESDLGWYWVYRDTIPLAPPIDPDLLIGFLPDTTYTDADLDTSRAYFYRVVASDGSSQTSEYSNMAFIGSGSVLSVPDPYGTIQAAVNAASALDTVLVAPGIYQENITLKDGVLVMSSDGRGITTIQSTSGAVVSANSLSDLSLLKGFTVSGLGSAQHGLDAWGSYVRVEDCAFESCNTGGRAQYGGAPTLAGNVFRSNQNGFAAADSAAPFLSGNTFDGNALGGLYVTGQGRVLVGGTLEDANDFVNRGAYHVFNMTSNTVAAEYNWWDSLCPSESWFYGPVDYTPWTDESHTDVYEECTGAPELEAGRAYASENFPNPFNPETAIRYTVPSPGAAVRLTVYDLRGRLVRTLVDGEQSEGEYLAVWRGRDDAGRELASGVYFYRMEIGDYQAVSKMVLLK